MHDEFTSGLARDGFNQAVIVEREPGGFMDTHAHPFEAKALVIRGEIRIRTENADRLFRVGDVFHLPANMPHTEHYGPEGVAYLVGRK